MSYLMTLLVIQYYRW